MGKPRMYGMKSPCIPNAAADMRYRKKMYKHNLTKSGTKNQKNNSKSK